MVGEGAGQPQGGGETRRLVATPGLTAGECARLSDSCGFRLPTPTDGRVAQRPTDGRALKWPTDSREAHPCRES